MRRLVIALLVLVGVLVAVDYGAAALTESAVSREMREQLALADDPDVRINGFPFLTQALPGRYRSVEVSADRIAVGSLRELELVAHLRDVTAPPLTEVLGSGSPLTLLVDRAQGTVRVGPNDLERLVPGLTRTRIDELDAEDLERAVEDGSDPRVARLDPDTAARVVSTVELFGQELTVAMIAVLGLVEGQIRVTPVEVRLDETDAAALPEAVQTTLSELFTVRITPGGLPLDVTPTEVRADDGALEISGTARDLTLGAAVSTATG